MSIVISQGPVHPESMRIEGFLWEMSVYHLCVSLAGILRRFHQKLKKRLGFAFTKVVKTISVALSTN